MDEDQRDDLIDQLLLTETTVWSDEEEVEHFRHATLAWWREVLGHPPCGPTHSCCKTCGCGGSCMLGAFEDALVTTVVRELDRIGALRRPEGGT